MVDNGSQSLPEAVCAAHPGVVLLQEPLAGPGPARNLGVARASGDVLAFIDADCLADPLWLHQAEAALADPAVMILGGDVRIALRDPKKLTALEAYESIYAPDLMLFDMPPMLVSDDAMAFMSQVDACERDLAAQTNVMGVVLNKCRYMGAENGYGYGYHAYGYYG